MVPTIGSWIENRRVKNEAGAVGGVEGLAFGILIFVFGSLVIAGGWSVVDARLATSAAAREAARSYVEADSEPVATAAASSAAQAAMKGHFREVSDLQILPTAGSASVFGRCNGVTVVVRARVKRAPIPLLARTGGTYTVTSRHSEIVDPYRNGLNGAASC